MNKDEIDKVIKRLKNDINNNEFFINETDTLSEIMISSLIDENNALKKAIKIFEVIGEVKNETNQK